MNRLKIAEVKKLDNGVSGIEIEGKIIKLLKDPNENEFGWSQFVKIQDDTGDIACWVNIETAEDAYKIGQYIKVKGKINKYMKGNKPQVSFGGNVIDEIVKVEDISQEQPESQPKTRPNSQPKTQEEPKKDMEEVWEAKDLRKARECAIGAVTALAVSDIETFYPVNSKKEYFEIADEIVDYIYNGSKKSLEFRGTQEEVQEQFDKLPKEYQEKLGDKEQKIVQARELVRNPHLTEPVDDTMATVKQKKLVYGYLNEKGEKIGGIVDSQYITEEETKNIGEWQNLTKAQGIKYYEYWYGKEGELGERDKRELAAKEKLSPFSTGRQPIETRDPKDDASLGKDLLIEKINKLRKDNHLEDEAKFKKAFDGCNTNFKLWTEKELTKLKEKLEMWKPDWVTK